MAKDLMTEISNERVAQRLAIVRRIAGTTQEEFATKAGLTRAAYNRWETANNPLSIEAATRLCVTYDLTLDYIFHGDTSGLRDRLSKAIYALKDATTPDDNRK
jgi:transcriptional regulator with XRE-family HTH domain